MSDHEKEEKKKEVPVMMINSDGSIKRFEDAGPGKPASKLDLLDSFLKQITGAVAAQPKSGSEEFKDIHSVDWENILKWRHLMNSKRKITELQQIAVSIEKKNTDEESIRAI